MKKVSLLFLLILGSICFGQQTGTFEWKHHVSYMEGVDVAPLGNKVYCGFKNSLVEYDTDESSYEQYTRVNYLSDLDITCVKSDNSKYLIVGYSSGNIDLLVNNTFYNLPDIVNGNQSGDKRIKDVYFEGDLAYVASGIGVVLFDLKKREVKDFFKPTLTDEVNDVAIYQDTIYVATAQGIYSAYKNHPFLANIEAWTQLSAFGILNSGDFTEIEATANELYTVHNSPTYLRDSCFKLSGIVQGVSTSGIENGQLSFYNDNLLCSGSILVQKISGTTASVELFGYTEVNTINVSNAIRLNGRYWIADKGVGLVRGVNTWSNAIVNINSPSTSSVYGVKAAGDRVVVTGGGLFKYTDNTFNSSGFYTLKGTSWSNINHGNSSLTFGKSFDYKSAAINPVDNSQYYVYGHSGEPLVQMSGSSIVEIYDTQNSELDSVVNATDIRLGGAAIDEDGFLWIGNSFSTEPLKIKTPEGLWYEASLGSSMNSSIIHDVNIDYFNMKWVSSQSAGIVVYDHNRTETDLSDDRMKVINTGEAQLPSNTVYCSRMDFDGEVWIGTSEGLAVIYNATDVFDENTTIEASRILVQKENDVEILLGTNSIIDIEIDGANRKWIVLEQSGLICLSPDGSEEIYNFNEENSPLVSNNITDIEIDHVTGEIYIATDKGLMSFRADASQADNEFENVKVFPNPVRPEYTGSVTVSGLGFNSHVNITDVSGNLVVETTSNGGTVTWDCKTTTGERVTTGVYLFWAGQNEAKGRKVAKVMVIN